MFLFCLCPVRSSLDSVLRPFFGVQNASFCAQKASLSVRVGRVRMKIHSAPFFESSSLKTRFSSKNAKILDPKQKRRKKRSLETQGIYIHTLSTFSDIHVQSCYCLCRLDLGDSSTLASPALNTGHLHFSTFQQAWSGGVLLGMFRDLQWCTPPLRGSWSRQRCPSVGPRRAPGPEPIECLGSNQSLGFEGCERSFWVSFTVHGVVLDIDMPGSPSLPMDRTVYKSVPMVSLYVPS